VRGEYFHCGSLSLNFRDFAGHSGSNSLFSRCETARMPPGLWLPFLDRRPQS
jgi:hypothetical protein